MTLHRFASRLAKMERAIASEFMVLRLVDGGTRRLPAGAAFDLSFALMVGEPLSNDQIKMLRLFVRCKPMPSQGALVEMLRREGPAFLRQATRQAQG